MDDVWSDPDSITKRFIHMMAYDAALDFALCQIGVLFAEAPPPMTRDYAHHDGWRT
jgi:hypothetical protein